MRARHLKIAGVSAATAIAVLASVLVLWATGHNVIIQSFFLPASGTVGYEVHASSSAMGLRLPLGDINAAGGYKVAYSYGHGGRVVLGSDGVLVPILGSSSGGGTGNEPATAGSTYQRMPYAGSVIGVALQSSGAVTSNAAHAEAVILSGTTLIATGLLTRIDGDANTQYNSATQAKDVDTFAVGELVTCRMTVDSGFLPASAILVCTIVIEY